MRSWRYNAAEGKPMCTRYAMRVLLAAALSISAASGAMSASAAPAKPTPQRGGMLEFAVDAEPPNYDCHSNISFAFIHPIAPHYSTLLKFDIVNYPQVQGDLAESWIVSPDRQTYTFKLRPNVLFHDGSPLTSEDVKASYLRIVRPPEGVRSARQADYAAITAIETPDPLTIVFRLQWPDAAMLMNFASPWNCIYSARKLQEDPQYPKAQIMGSGPFTFVEHIKGDHWTAKRWSRYFAPGKPYLDGYRAVFMSGAKTVKEMQAGRILAQFRSFSPAERDELVNALGENVVVHEAPWLSYLSVVFNVNQKPFDDVRVRLALSLAIDRWQGAASLADTTFLKYVGGLMRPGTPIGTPEAELASLPGYSRDIAAARQLAKKLLSEAGVPKLALTLLNRGDVAIPYAAAGDWVVASWREIGVEVTQQLAKSRDWQNALETGQFAAAIDFGADHFDDPTIQLARYVSRDLSPNNHARSTDRFLDALYIGQAVTTDPRERVKIVREFERHALTEACSVPLLWWNRIIVTSSKVKGWNMSPSHYIGQDLADVWLQE